MNVINYLILSFLNNLAIYSLVMQCYIIDKHVVSSTIEVSVSKPSILNFSINKKPCEQE